MTYRDPAKDFRKVSDFDVQEWRPGLRELYERSATASLMAAAILAGHGGGFSGAGEAGKALALAAAALDALSCADEACCERILLHFLWNWADLLGNRGGGLRRCTSCACEFTGDGVLWFIPGEGFFCKNCVDFLERKTAAVVGPGARRWLLAVQDRPPSELAGFTLDTASLGELKSLVTMLVQ
jgi:DNA repair protein RecO (recombination protein O)